MKTRKQITNILTVAVAILLCAGISSAQYVPDANLLAAWEFNVGDVSGANVAASGGSAANTTGTLQADAAATNGVLTLDGSGDYLQFGSDVTDLRNLGAMTIAAWVQTASAAGSRRIVSHEDNFYGPWAEAAAFKFTIHGGGGGNAESTTAPVVGTWQHVLVTYQSGQPAKIYVNGVWEDDSGNQAAMPNATHTFQIGANRSGSGTATAFWDGLIDDVAIWNRVLTPAEIGALGAGGVYANRALPATATAATPGTLIYGK